MKRRSFAKRRDANEGDIVMALNKARAKLNGRTTLKPNGDG